MTSILLSLLWIISGLVAGVVMVRSNPNSGLNFDRNGIPKKASPSEQGVIVLMFVVLSPIAWSLVALWGFCWLVGRLAIGKNE